MKVELVAYTAGQPGTEFEGKSIDEIIVGMARVSSSRETNDLFQEPEKLLRHCIQHGHWSVFATCNITFKVETSRAMGRELLRHQVLPQELCITGDSKISFVSPNGSIFYRSIEDLYDIFSLQKEKYSAIEYHSRTKIKNCNIKTFNLNSKLFDVSKIRNVFKNGIKDIYEIQLSDGKIIKSTLDHKYLNEKYQFFPIKDICNIIINTDNSVISFEKAKIAVNGKNIYQDKEWLYLKKIESIENKLGLKFIAQEANVSTHTIKKWLKKFNLSFTKKEVSQYTQIWNKNKKGYSIKPWSFEARENASKRTPKGKDHHSYKGGGRNERELISSFLQTQKRIIFEKHGNFCNICKSVKNIHLHHIEEVTRNPYKAYDIENIIPLCSECHSDTHKKLRKQPYDKIYDLNNFDWKSVRPDYLKDNPISFFSKTKRKFNFINNNKYTVNFVDVEKIKYLGKNETFDLEIESESHNYVANKIVVHNSQRYTDSPSYEPIELRKQAKTNRQSSLEPVEDIETITKIHNHLKLTADLYTDLINLGVSRETSRMIQPETATTIMYLNAPVRVWLSVLNQRLHKTAQKEIREVAELMRDQFIEKCPIISKMMFNFDGAYECHIFDRIILDKYHVYEVLKKNKFKKPKEGQYYRLCGRTPEMFETGT